MDNYRRQTVGDILGTKPGDKRVAKDVKRLCESLRKLAKAKYLLKCPRCGKSERIERWTCPMYEGRQYHPYNDDQLYHRTCGHREMVRKGTTPDHWKLKYEDRP